MILLFFLLSFLDVSIAVCLLAFSDTTWHESNHHPPPSIDHLSTQYSHSLLQHYRYLRSQLLSMTSSTVAGETPGSLGYTPSWSSPGNPNNNPNSNNVSSSQAGAMQPKQRIHSSIPEVPDAAPTGGMTPGSPGSRASPVTVNRMGAGAEDVDSDPASSSSIMPKLMVASTSSLTIETTHLM